MEMLEMGNTSLSFGPVPSRRLGRSLGINNIPAKICSYSCVYCQVGKTTDIAIKRQRFYNPRDVFEQVERKVKEADLKGEKIDYLTFVPDGEPTLDLNLGKEIFLLKEISLPKTVLTNASLLWLNEVREDLLNADYVSLKIDAVNENLWKRKNRPHKDLQLDTILEGITDFAGQFRGTLVSETMLIDGVENRYDCEKIADFLNCLKKLDKAYIAIPTRPPAERWVKPAKEEDVNTAFQVFSKKLGTNRVEYLIGYEGNAFACTGNVVDDLLAIMAVHPMRGEAVEEFLRKADSNWAVLESLLREGRLVKLLYEGNEYYMRSLSRMRSKLTFSKFK
jgi:wyosine [tRNA(Phe)-imidazoG37] synthetase (radical SAM superfamily)